MTALFPCALPAYDVARIRCDFPILAREVHGTPLVYLDSAASAQKPRMVTEAMTRFYERDYANIHRGVHALSVRATDLYEGARETVRRFLNAARAEDIVFTRGATEAINLVAHSWGGKFLNAGDEVVLTHLEHHANIVPWQLLRDAKGIHLKVVPITDNGEVRLEDFIAALSSKTKLAAFAHVSNALGTILPVAEMIHAAHERGILALVDGCQSVNHIPTDVHALDADFYVFSAHKLYGPTGIGALYAKKALLKSMPPYQGGGDMIASVTFEKTTFREPPARFEAGTPPIAEAIGLAAALDYVSTIGLERIAAHEDALLAHATAELTKIPGLRLIGTAPHKAAIASFILDGIHPHDIGTILDSEGVAIRAGHHCAQPLMERFQVPATVRASFAMYNSHADVEALIKALQKVREIFA